MQSVLLDRLPRRIPENYVRAPFVRVELVYEALGQQQRTSGSGSCRRHRNRNSGAIQHCDKRLWPLHRTVSDGRKGVYMRICAAYTYANVHIHLKRLFRKRPHLQASLTLSSMLTITSMRGQPGVKRSFKETC